MSTIPPTLTQLQLELLKIYSFEHSEEDLLAIKKMLAEYFAKKLVKQVDAAVAEKNISSDDLNRWLNEGA